MFNLANEILIAEKKIRDHIRETQLDYSISLSQHLHTHVYLKCENLQYTGAFKVRGALNKLLSLSLEERKQGIVTASSGNHGAAIAYGLDKLNIPGVIFVPENASSTKIANIRNYKAELKFHATDCMDTEKYALEYAKKNNMIYVSPYNDIEVITGQGTIGIELMRQLNKIDAIFVPIGGGGLISGIAAYIKSVSPETKIIGCMPENSPVMLRSIEAGHIIEMETLPTLSDATAGGIEPGSITFDICKELVDDYVLVSEDEIKSAIIAAIKTQHLLIEGAAGVALASLYKNAKPYENKNVVVILSGSNISLETLQKVLSIK